MRPVAVTPEVTPEVIRLLEAIVGEMKRTEIQQDLKLSDEKHFRARYLKPAINQQLIEMTIPDAPRSRLQKYRLTNKGRATIKKYNRN